MYSTSICIFLITFKVITVVLAFSPVHSSMCLENEIRTDCVNPCNTCEQRGRCDYPPPPCQRGCECKPGYLRDENGFCVQEQQCIDKPDNSKCPKNALFLPCVNFGFPTCENPFPDPDYADECLPGCVCRPGFLKRKDGQCVTRHQCHSTEGHEKETPSVCREDEEYYECTPSCKNTCENYSNPGVRCGCGPPGCFCREGLVKRADGKCIHPRKCPRLPSQEDSDPKCPKDAIFLKCGSPCPPNCDDLQPEPCEEKCTTACYCKPGYLKRKDGVCVRPTDCHPRKKQSKPTPKCPENAVFIQCGSPCPPTCEDRLPEPCEEKCTKACYCKPGFLLKTDEKKCVKPEHCNTNRITAAPLTECSVDEQFYECTPSCKNTCSNFSNPAAKCQCGPPGCFCKEGLVKREDGKCVPLQQCRDTPQPECAPDERFYECTPSCKNTCSHFLNPGVQCRCGPPGCFCKEGLVKRLDGKCVPLSECPGCLYPGEEFQECGSTCPASCENRGRPSLRSCPHSCSRGCFCKKGLYRTKNGHCVPLKDCDTKHYSTTTSKPITTSKSTTTTKSTTIKEKTDATTVPDDCHGCPNRAECEAYCKSLGDFVGLCVGGSFLHCRCT